MTLHLIRKSGTLDLLFDSGPVGVAVAAMSMGVVPMRVLLFNLETTAREDVILMRQKRAGDRREGLGSLNGTRGQARKRIQHGRDEHVSGHPAERIKMDVSHGGRVWISAGSARLAIAIPSFAATQRDIGGSVAKVSRSLAETVLRHGTLGEITGDDDG
jgi:hypothetical protein